jgi:AcrR family transcriptional regulator
MAREVKEHEIRKTEIVNAAQTQFLNKGYNATTIQDIIDTLGIAKGTFYHYFKSKDELLDEIIERMTTEMSDLIRTILETNKSALEKFNDVFKLGRLYKVENIDVFMILMKTLYREENNTIRDRMFRSSIRKNGPIIAEIVKQGIEEGVFDTPYPESIAEIMINHGKTLNEGIVNMILDPQGDPDQIIGLMIHKTKIYQETLERILGARPGSLQLYKEDEFANIVREFAQRVQQDRVEKTDKRYRMW